MSENYAQELFDKLDNYIEEQENNDFHCIPGTMCTTALWARINSIKDYKEYINNYFISSPDVWDVVSNYPLRKMMRFLERIIKYVNTSKQTK